MRRHKRSVITAAIAAIAIGAAAVSTATATSTHRQHKAATTTCTKVAVNGRVAHYTKLTFAQLRALPAQTADVTFQAGTATQTHHYVGALLTDVVNVAGPTFNPAIKNDSLRFYIKALASDDYAAIVSWGEIDPSFGAKNVLLAYEEDGKDLCTVGPRLVVPGDIKGGRYVSGVVRLQVGRAGGDN